MSRRISLFISIVIILINFPSYAGWPEDGWEGVSSLNFMHKGKLLELDTHHVKLAKLEKEVSAILSQNTPTNMVLVTVSLLSTDGGLQSHYIVGGPSLKPYVFESSWTSMISNPVFDEAQNILRPFATTLHKGEALEGESRSNLITACQTVVQKQRYFEELASRFHFQENRPEIKDILAHIERTFSDLPEGAPGSAVVKEFKKDKEAYEREVHKLTKIKEDACAIITESSRKLSPATLTDDLLKEIEDRTKLHRTALSKQQKTIENIGSKVIATYWHSEERFLTYLKMQTQAILEYILKNKIPLDAVIINIHSRFDICSVCSHSLAQSYTSPKGILTEFKKAICTKLELQNVPLYISSSFREERTKSSFKVGSKRIDTLDDFVKLNPAFPLMHIPLV